jgi:CheY-like chemotaxis protein
MEGAVMSTSTSQNPHSLNVLVVDDYADNAKSTAMLLKLFGHKATVAHDGPSALQAADAIWPDVVLLDIGLPGMHGYEVARQLRHRAAGKSSPALVAVTGFALESDRARCFAEGFDLYLTKPFDPEVLQNALTELAKRNGAGNGLATDAAENDGSSPLVGVILPGPNGLQKVS